MLLIDAVWIIVPENVFWAYYRQKTPEADRAQKRFLGIGLVTNCPLTDVETSHEDVARVSEEATPKIRQLIEGITKRLAQRGEGP